MTNITVNSDGSINISVTMRLDGSLMEMENTILEVVNEIGNKATEEALKRFDTDGSPIIKNEVKLTARSKDAKSYQTPYGVAKIDRYVYQSSKGGKIYCPLEDHARIIHTATPKFAQQISHKYALGNAMSVRTDLEENHNRSIAKSTIQNVADWVGGIACAKEEVWEYALPDMEEPITTAVFSMDGAYLLMANEGYREALVGNISLYDCEGKRQHTIYLFERLNMEKPNLRNVMREKSFELKLIIQKLFT